MKKLLLVQFFALLTFFAFQSEAQKIQYLNQPNSQSQRSAKGGASGIDNDGITFGSGGSNSDEGTIYYGSIPSGSSGKPVIVFVHGYSSSASTWWDGNDMYSKAFNAGFRTAFVSLGPDKDSYFNGNMLNGMLSTIRSYYGVNKVVIVAHSKGGVDSDAALVYYGATSKVSRVVTLGSPHFGTPLADLAQSSWTWWLAAVFGQYNDGTAQLQTGVMSSFRNTIDNHPNNGNADFRTIGAWGYSGSLLVPGWYLNANGGGSGTGGNDGVVPYYSTLRPNAAHLLGGYGDSRTDLNHFEVAEGQYVWQYIQPQIAGAPSNRVATSERINPTAKVISTAQVVGSENGQVTFVIEEGVSKAFVDVKLPSKETAFIIKDANGNTPFASQRRATPSYDRLMKNYSSKVELNAPQAGTYTIEASEGVVAVIATEQGVGVEFTSDLNDNKFVYGVGEKMNFNIGINGAKSLAGVKVTGIMQKTSDLRGNAARGDEAFVLDFSKKGADFAMQLNEQLEEGVYNISINVESPNFRKSVITSVAVVDGLGNGQLEEKASAFELLSNFPNPFGNATKIAFQLKEKAVTKLTIYDAFGKAVQQFDLSDYEAGKYEINWEPKSSLKNGMYVYELSNGTERVSKKMILVR